MKATDRCKLCGAPLQGRGQTGYCSERCLAWDFFGVPTLKEGALVKEIRRNQQRDTLPDDWKRPMPYPGFGEEYQRTLVGALGALKQACDQVRETDE